MEATQMKTIDEILSIRGNRHRIEDLSKVYSLVPFIGAGMSSGIYPMWRNFLEEFELLADERVHLNKLIDLGEFEEAASYIFSLSKRGFVETVKEVFSPKHLEGKVFSPALRILPKLTDGMILTTNLDELLENVWQHEGKNFDAIITPDYEDQFNQAIANNSRFLVKLHGTVKESSKYVLTKEQYNEYYGVNSNDTIDFNKPFPRDLGRAMQAKTLLFLGCSLKNDRVLHILKQIAGWNEYVKHYAILALADDEETTIRRERELENYGIFPIWFPDKDYNCILTILNELLRLKKNITR